MTALRDIGLQTHLESKDLIKISMREMLLFILQLFNALPHYDPKTTIEFKCILGEEVVKTIELSNPTPRTITYWVKL